MTESDPVLHNLPPQVIRRDDGMTIAYHFTPGKSPGIVFLPGFRSDMTGSKALELEDMCRRTGRAYLRFDYSGHGQSGGDFEFGTIGSWTDDAIYVLDKVTKGPQILVGSSMGGWIMLLVALERPHRIAGLLGVAAAPDFTEDLLPRELSDEQKRNLARTGIIHVPSEYDEMPTPITQALLDEGRTHLLLRQPIPLDCPVRLIHGMADPDVPWQTALRISQMIQTDDVEIQFVKAGTHRMSEPPDLARLTRTLAELVTAVEQA
ncbi:MAG: alpha/beta hydrolase [Hyphomicrobiales bacterium]|nr:alpha/beta hydrolase [Hyphomicrobiales bacterium]